MMIFTRQIAFVGLILLGGLSFLGEARVNAQEKQPHEWQRFTVSGEEFSVMLPAVPAMMTRRIHPQINQSRRERVIGAYGDGVVYMIHAFEKRAITMDVLLARFSRNYPAQVTEQVTVSGLTGKSSSSDDGRIVRATYYFETKRNLYLFQAAGSKTGNPAVGIPKFLSSISFEKNPAGIKIIDGPGEVAASDESTIVSAKEVSARTVIIAKPEPQYTEAARKGQVSGTVVLRAMFSASGAITDIEVLVGLKDGLTEQAIAAARQIKFIPAAKDGKFVSVRMQLEYSFNLY